MRKSAAIGDWKLATPFKAWRGATGSPLGSAAAVYALGALGTYAAWPYLSSQVGGAVKAMSGTDPGDLQDAEDTERDMRDSRLRASLLLPLIPAGLHLGGMADFSGTYPNLGLTSWHDGVKKQASWGLEANGADFDRIMSLPTVPFGHSVGLIQDDPVLDAYQKGKVLNVFGSAPPPNNAGFISPGDLATGAVRAGAGYLAGHLAGKMMGSLFSLPQPVTSKLSAAGGIGMALINMGVL